MIDYIEKAKAFAMMAHKGQTDKAGEDYFTAHMTYAEYIWRVKQNDIAVKVKRADLVSNMDLNRIPYPLTIKDLAREAKYLRAYKMLDGRKTVSAVNPYALYDYLITCG